MLARSERPLPERLLERIYPMPRPALTHEEYQRARHRDLPELDETDLAIEAFRLMSRLAREHDPARRGWLAERREAIRAEQGRRRDADRQASAAPDPVALVWGAPGARRSLTASAPSNGQRPLTPIRGGGRRGR